MWLVVRPADWVRDFKGFAALGLACLIPLVFYALMLSNRSQTMDDVQLLVLTHAPDVRRMPELIGFAVIAMVFLAALINAIKLIERPTLFVLSLALVPIVVFNQQIITGRSLQPIHYQVFIGNYVAAFALILTLGILRRGISQKYSKVSNVLAISLAVIASIWGIVECHYTVRVLDDANVERDEAVPVARKLTELAKTDVASPDSNHAVVLPFSMIQGDDLPTVAPQAVLWARHQHVFAGETWAENKERYYQYLYYMNLDETWLEKSMKDGDFVSTIALFGWGRHTDRLSADAKPLKYGEIEEEADKFGEYRKNFGLQQASHPTLSYLVIPSDWSPDFTNIDIWYERDAGETFGKYTLYRVKLKTPAK